MPLGFSKEPGRPSRNRLAEGKIVSKDRDVVSHVSDTALWVAMYRAMETDRPDAIFRDPYARRLAGAKGETILATMPQARRQAWAMIVRTKVFDEIITRLVAECGVDSVLNLAAGLDTRPFRLSLPPGLRWTDADFSDIVEYKRGQLAGETPSCIYESVAVDLADERARRALFDRVAARSKRTLVVSEGLLIYLMSDHVRSIGSDLAAYASFAYWLFDLAGPLLLKFMNRTWGRRLDPAQARFQFAPEEGPRFFEPLGWRTAEYHSNWDEARRLKREMPLKWIWNLMVMLSWPARRREFRTMAGTVLVERIPSI
jgi:methyltransferase (TIGR00027 family)